MPEIVLTWSRIRNEPAKDIREWPANFLSASFALLDRGKRDLEHGGQKYEIIDMDVACIYRGPQSYQYLRSWTVRPVEQLTDTHRPEGK